MTATECVAKVRALRQVRDIKLVLVGVATATGGGRRACYNCGEVGHLRARCPKTGVKCFNCHQFGHRKADCPKKRSGSSKAVGAVSSDKSRKKAPCLAVQQSPSSDVHLVYVNVSTRAEQDQWSRKRAAVDTGAARSLISSAAVDDLGVLSDVKPTTEGLVAIDGSDLLLKGSIDLNVRRLDGPVHLPLTMVSFLVVEHLGVVSADVIIGSDPIQTLGGVTMKCDQGQWS